mmetsp:Transcript_51562/g.120243  ORF Transcript_51562/g.120243 Transcript_51562/m.120243 type:complete len:205 (-) Transcript_51562:164-778(-)
MASVARNLLAAVVAQSCSMLGLVFRPSFLVLFMEPVHDPTSCEVIILRHGWQLFWQRRAFCNGTACHFAGVNDATSMDVFGVLAGHEATVSRDCGHPIRPNYISFALPQGVRIWCWLRESLLGKRLRPLLRSSQSGLQRRLLLNQLPLLLPRSNSYGCLRATVDVLCFGRWYEASIARYARVHALLTRSMARPLQLFLRQLCWG